MKTFICRDCGEELPLNLRGSEKNVCRPCRYRRKKSRWTGSLPTYLGKLKSWARQRARKKGLKFDLDREYLEALWQRQRGKCALTGLHMTRPDNCRPETLRAPTNVSLDRIDSSLGYIRGNVQLVCHRVNQLKGNLDEVDLLFWCRKIIRNSS